MRCLAFLFVFGVSFFQAALTIQAQQFQFVEPTGQVTATVDLIDGRLIINELSGQRFIFNRELRYDSIDGLFASFYNADLNRIIRFPRSGVGVMQTADFDDPTPRYRSMRRRVRPVRAGLTPTGFRSRFDYGPVTVGPGLSYGSSPSLGHGSYDAPIHPYQAGFRGRFRQPQSILLESKTVVNPPLPPTTLQLTNSGPRELRVTVADLVDPMNTRRVKVQPRQRVSIQVERDSGGSLVQVYRTVTPLGEVIMREVTTPIPPAIRYEVIAHEWAMQSIAIDRTGRSPNVIEDVQHQGRGIGRFQLPPGDQIRSGTIDVYSAAKQAGNQGSVTPIVAQPQTDRGNASALERAILDAQQSAIQRRK